MDFSHGKQHGNGNIAVKVLIITQNLLKLSKMFFLML